MPAWWIPGVRWRRPRRRLHRALAVMMTGLALLSQVACSPVTGSSTLPQGPAIPVGITIDEPGVSLEHDGVYSGLDVDVARYVTGVLGYGQSQVVFVPVSVQDVSEKLESGTIDVAFSALPADAGSREAWQYVGPYLSARQGLMVRADDRKDISGPGALANRVVCVVDGSGADVEVGRRSPDAVISSRASYKKCLTALMVGQADAVAGDDAVLSGLVKAEGAGLVAMSSWRYGQSPHAVVVRSGATELSRTVKAALVRMVRDGSWAKMAASLRENADYRVASTLTSDHIEIHGGSVSS